MPNAPHPLAPYTVLFAFDIKHEGGKPNTQ